MPRGLKLAGDIVQGAAGMIPSTMMSAVNPTMGLQMMGLSAAGSSAQEAMEQGATKGRALAYGGSPMQLKRVPSTSSVASLS